MEAREGNCTSVRYPRGSTIRYLPMLKNSPKAVATTKKGNIPFKDPELAAIILAALPFTWQNQYNLMHSMVPKSQHALSADVENIERIMLERHGKKQRSKDKTGTAHPEKGKPNKGVSKGGSSI